MNPELNVAYRKRRVMDPSGIIYHGSPSNAISRVFDYQVGVVWGAHKDVLRSW